MLDLDWNRITEDSGQYLANALQTNTAREVPFSPCFVFIFDIDFHRIVTSGEQNQLSSNHLKHWRTTEYDRNSLLI
jgi:hypothetical protein